MSDDGGDVDGLRRDLAKLVHSLLEEGQRREPGEPVMPAIRAHLGVSSDDVEMPIFSEELSGWELPNLQLALDAAVAREGWQARVLGLGAQARHFADFSLSGVLVGEHFRFGPAEFVNVPVGPSRTLPCLEVAVVLARSPDGPVAALLFRGGQHMGQPELSVQATSPVEGLAQRFLADLRELMDAHDVYRGQVLTLRMSRHGEQRIAFLERPAMDRSELVLPPGALDRIESHILGPTRHRDQLLAQGRHLSRGLLLWGPPGTGKTHTVRYLTGHLEDATIIILSGASLGMVGGFGNLARHLAPSVVILEDVDLVAQERHFGPFGESPVLFELMNQMSGLAEDADIAFVLTTNRPDVLEPALAARPGRIDLAVEIPLPDRDARAKLVDLYGRGLDISAIDRDAVLDRTDGVTASFIKELLRKAALTAAQAEHGSITDDDMTSALDELLSHTAALTRTLLGVPSPDRPPGTPAAYPQASATAHGWMAVFPGADD